MASKFTGEHSTIMINLDHVVYAKSEDASGGAITVYFAHGIKPITLQHGNADMFRAFWRNRGNESDV